MVAAGGAALPLERGACHTHSTKGKLRDLGPGWVLLQEELLRGAAPDYRVLTIRWSLLGHDGKTRVLDLPMSKLWEQLPASLLGVAQSKRNSAGHTFDNVHLSTMGSAGVVVGERGDEVAFIARVAPPAGVRGGRKLAVLWRVEAGTFHVAKTPLAEAGSEDHFGFVAGHDAQGRWLFVATQATPGAGGRTTLRYEVKRLEPETGALVSVASSGPVERTGDSVNAASRCVFSDARDRLACAEYQEDPAHPSGVHVFDLKTGEAKVLAAPATSYVLAFDAAGGRLAIGGNRDASVWVYDLASGARVVRGRGPSKMHQGAYLADGSLLLHGEGAPTRYDAKLKPSGTVSLSDAFGPGAKGGFLPRGVDWRDVARVGVPMVRGDSMDGFGDAAQICWLRQGSASKATPAPAPAAATAPAPARRR